jgi:hypothetical protein
MPFFGKLRRQMRGGAKLTDVSAAPHPARLYFG